jgi:hypothetical protein
MTGLPERNEAAPYYYTYIDLVTDPDIVSVLEKQVEPTAAFLRGISERVFLSRALWFARGFESPLPSFDQNVAVSTAQADAIPWARHIDEYRQIRAATVSFFRNLPAEAWKRSGVASGNPFTVRSLAYIVAGHTEHHLGILRERYMGKSN